MTDTTTRPLNRELLKNRTTKLASWIRRFDRWMAICDKASQGDYSEYNVRRMPSKASKGHAYDDGYAIATMLGVKPELHNVDDLRRMVALAKAA